MDDSDSRGGSDAPPLHVPGKYLSLTTFRRDGTPVATPVWFAEDGGRLYVVTPARSHKARRLRRNPSATVAPCNARGTVKGEPRPAKVAFLPESEFARIDQLMADRYRIRRRLIMPIYRLVMKARGMPIDQYGGAYLEISAA